MQRPYRELLGKIEPQPDRPLQMKALVDLLWDALHPTGVSWLGFYLHAGGDQLLLGPRRDKPACSPIGMHGACGQAFRVGRTIIIRDVRELGDNYVACDPRDQSEIVIPLFERDGRCWGVFDADSYDLGAFNEDDAAGLARLLAGAGLTDVSAGT